jgi:ABC-type uncharacterized transport system auxiliary subunit
MKRGQLAPIYRGRTACPDIFSGSSTKLIIKARYMNIKTGFLFLVFFSLLAFHGCSSRKAVVKKFYIIDLQESNDNILSDSLPTILKYCEITPVNVYPAYATTQILVRSESHEVRYFTYHEWAVRPQEILTRLMEEYFRQHRVFKEASIRFWKNIPDVQVESSLFNLEVFEENNDYMAHLNIELRLIDNESGEIVLRHRGNNYRKLDKKNLNLFAAAISEMFHQELREFSIKAMTLLSPATTP